MNTKEKRRAKALVDKLATNKPLVVLERSNPRRHSDADKSDKMTWQRLLCAERLGGPSITPPEFDPRTPFESDVGRIVFTSSFRRLARKTQVHPLSANDNIHSRLTHSIEVAEVGRSLGKCLESRISERMPPGTAAGTLGAIVQAACLAHDLGNPPFGHAGESAILQWFDSNGEAHLKGFSLEHQQDIKSFEGNAQGFRIITQTENHVFGGGLRLTYATLGSFLKYPWSSRTVKAGSKFGAYLTEERILSHVADKLGLIKKADNAWARHPLAYLVEAADDICYSTLDLEDAVELRLLSFAEAKTLLCSALTDPHKSTVSEEMADDRQHRTNFMRMRGPVFSALINAAVESFLAHYDQIMEGSLEVGKDLFSLLPDDDVRGRVIKTAKKLASERVYPSQRKVEIELGCFAIFDTLLDAYCHAALECARELNASSGDRSLSWRSKLVLKLIGNHAPSRDNKPSDRGWSNYECMRRMLDYISGMTDNYAEHIAAQLRGSFSN